MIFLSTCRGAARIIPHPLQQLLRLKSCPASNYDRIPQNHRGASHFSLRWDYSFAEIHPTRTRNAILTHIQSRGADEAPLTSGMKAAQRLCRCFSSSSSSSSIWRRLVRLLGAHAGLGCRALLTECYWRKIMFCPRPHPAVVSQNLFKVFWGL